MQTKFHDPEFEQASRDYALKDAVTCLDLWRRGAAHWPKHEQQLSALTIEQGRRGIYIDMPLLLEGIATLENECRAQETRIPWVGAHAVTSPLALRAECQRAGLPVPASTAKTDEDFAAWLDAHANAAPWVGAMQQWRKANRLLRVMETIRERTDLTTGRMRFGLKYYGAAVTGRWSGSSGLNLQNLNRDTVCGVNVRNVLRAAPGHRLVVADLSQIEPRCLAWLCGDAELLERLRAGVPLYQAHAEQTMGWQGGKLKSENPHLYALAKARVLGLGYGCGAKQFVNVARIMAGLSITIKDAVRIVAEYRQSNPAVTALWNRLEDWIRENVGKQMAGYKLPSGRWMRYFNVTETHDCKVKAAVLRGGPVYFWHGAKLVENLVQSVARDVFAHGMLRAEELGIPTLFSVHDEIVAEVPEDRADETLTKLISAMREVPAWLPGVPLEAEGSVMERYSK